MYIMHVAAIRLKHSGNIIRCAGKTASVMGVFRGNIDNSQSLIVHESLLVYTKPPVRKETMHAERPGSMV
jgi:hypothetical protein